MELLIVRHGETVANTKNLIQGQTHGSLTEKGEAQARLVARRLKEEEDRCDLLERPETGEGHG